MKYLKLKKYFISVIWYRKREKELSIHIFYGIQSSNDSPCVLENVHQKIVL